VIEARIETLEGGTVIYDAAHRDSLSSEWFNVEYWLEHGARIHSSTGRTPVTMMQHGTESWVLRHYHRGGLMVRLIDDHYLWTGLERSRPFREWRLLSRLTGWNLPAPRPIAACVRRRGLFYRADIITRYLPSTRPLSAYLREEAVQPDHWRRIGNMVRGFHDHGVDHPDLTAHNILIDMDGATHLVDFDRAVIRPLGSWRKRGIARLKRSFRKVALETGTRFDQRGWSALLEAYSLPDRRGAARPDIPA
jgi:3-deoxy-D-manno-octulosonic acid kinase